MGNIQITSPGIRKALKRYSPEQSVAEYIWNGFDAQATYVDLEIEANAIGHISLFRIVDNGYGIPVEKLRQKFEPFFESEKEVDPNAERTTSAIHGKNGVGRLTFFSFSQEATWDTVYSIDGQNIEYSITVRSETLNTFVRTEPVQTTRPTGTSVSFLGIHAFTMFDFENAIYDFLIREFGWFLELNAAKGYAIRINGEDLDYSAIVGARQSFIHLERHARFEIRYVRWKKSINREFSRYYFIDSSDNERHKATTTLNYKGDRFFHSVYVRSEFFNEYYPSLNGSSDNGQLSLTDDQAQKVFKGLMKTVDDFLRAERKPFLRAYSNVVISEFEKSGAFPHFDGNEWDKFRRSELEELVRELYQVEPKIFSNLNTEQRRTFIHLLNLIMGSGERDRLLEVIGAIVELDSSELEELAQLLKVARLSNIVKTMRLLEDRYRAIEELKDLVFNKELGTNEGHIQRFIEGHYWIFGEQYHLVTAAEPKFEEALRRFTYLLRGEAGEARIDHPDKNREMDIFAVRQDHQNDVIDSIVVELKHPRVRLGSTQLEQVKRYMQVILKQDQFNASNMFWQFYLVGNSFDDTGYIDNELQNASGHGERHLTFRAANYRIYVKKWSEIFAEFDLRHQFLYRQLQLEREKLISSHENADAIVKDALNSTTVQPGEVVIPSMQKRQRRRKTQTHGRMKSS